jgi:hypothetical protein
MRLTVDKQVVEEVFKKARAYGFGRLRERPEAFARRFPFRGCGAL